MPKHNTNTTRAKQTAERQKQALELRLAGHDYRTIARRIGYAGPGSAYKAVSKALDAITLPSAEEYRQQQLARVYAIHAALWPKAKAGDTEAIRLLDKLWTTLDRYSGFDAAQATLQDPTRQVASMLDQLLASSIENTK